MGGRREGNLMGSGVSVATLIPGLLLGNLNSEW